MGTSMGDLDFQKAKQASLHQRPAHKYCNTRGHHLLRSCRLLSSAGISVTQHLKSLSLLAPMTSTQMEPMTPLSGMGTIKVEDLKTAHPSSKSSWLAPAFGITNDKSKLRKKVNLFSADFRLAQVPAAASTANARPLRSSRDAVSQVPWSLRKCQLAPTVLPQPSPIAKLSSPCHMVLNFKQLPQ